MTDHARRQDPRRPDGRQVGQRTRTTPSSSTRPTSASSRSSSSAPASPARRRRRRSAELGYQVDAFTFHDSPRRAHSIAAQGGINAAKNYHGDGDSRPPPVLRHGQGRRLPLPRGQRAPPGRGQRRTSSTRWSPRACRSPASTAACSTTAASAAPRSAARSTPVARPASSCCSAPTSSSPARSGSATSACSTASSWSTSCVVDGKCAGIVTRDLLTGEFASHAAHAVVLCTGGYGNAFFLSTNAMNCNVTAAWRAHRKGAYFANPCYTQIHPTCIPQATTPSRSSR